MRVLSIGFVRELWLPPDQRPGDTLQRLAHYATRLDAYRVLVPTRSRDVVGEVDLGNGGRASPVTASTTPGLVMQVVRAALREGRAMRPDVIQAQDPVHSGLPAYIAARHLGVPVNLCVYGTNPFDTNWQATTRLNRWTTPLAQALLRRADGVQVDGSETARSLAAHGINARRIVLKPMVPVNIDAFFRACSTDEARRRLVGGDAAAFVALFVGRFVPQKHLRLLVDVLVRTAEVAPQLRMALIGDGPERAVVEAEAAARGVADRLVWIGPIGHDALPSWMASADAFVLPSNYEGFARVLMEAAAAARPIVSTRVSGADDAVIDGETGTLVPVGDAAAFAAALLALVFDPVRGRRQGEAGREHLRTVAARYGDLDAQLDLWRDLVARSS